MRKIRNESEAKDFGKSTYGYPCSKHCKEGEASQDAAKPSVLHVQVNQYKHHRESALGTYPAGFLTWYMDVHAPKTGDQVHRAARDKLVLVTLTQSARLTSIRYPVPLIFYVGTV